MLKAPQYWSRKSKWLLVTAGAVAFVACGILVYGIARRYALPPDTVLVGTWQDMTPSIDSTTYYRFRPDHTFDLLADPLGESGFLIASGRWHAGGPLIYLRFPRGALDTHDREGKRLVLWHIVDVSDDEIRVRFDRDGPVIIWKRLEPSSARASNQAMQLTASKPAANAWSVCRREHMLGGMHMGLAAADLVSR